jgi:biopolymer transport protein ExbD
MVRSLLVLAIILVATVPLAQTEIDAEARHQPNWAPAPPVAEAAIIVLDYSAAGSISINQQAVTFHDLHGRLREIYARRTEKTLYISGAPTLRYRQILNVMHAAKNAGVNRVGIITEAMLKAENLRSAIW